MLLSTWSHLCSFTPGHGQRKKVERGIFEVTCYAAGQRTPILINRHISCPGEFIGKTKIEGARCLPHGAKSELVGLANGKIQRAILSFTMELS